MCSLSAAQKNKAIVIVNATIINCTGAAEKPNSTVVITGDRIAEVGRIETTLIPDGARVVDGSGKFLMINSVVVRGQFLPIAVLEMKS